MSNFPDGLNYNDPNNPWNDVPTTKWKYDHDGYCKKCASINGDEVQVDTHNICEECFESEPIEED